MRTHQATRVVASSVLLWSSLSSLVSADDWPCFRGPSLDGKSAEPFSPPDWTDGPRVVWSRDVGAAFSSFACVDGRLYTCGSDDKQQVLLCMDAQSGEVHWKKPFEPEMTDPDPNLYGTRATPTVSDGRVYVVGGHGRVLCCDARDGRELWELRLKHQPNWGYAGSVLILGDRAIVQGGGADGSLLALNRRTGAVLWRCGEAAAAYATPYPFQFNGRTYVVGFLADRFIIANAETGELAAEQEWPSHSGVNAATPIVHDGRLLLSTGYGYGAGLFKLADADGKLKLTPLWKGKSLKNKFQTPILHAGRLYASDETALKCLEFDTGKLLWQVRGVRHGSMTFADGYLVFLSEVGELQIAPATADGFKPATTAKLFEGSKYSFLKRKQGRRCWTAPVLCNGLLYCRDHDTVVCVETRAPVGDARR